MSTTTRIPQRAWVEQIMGLPISIHVRGDELASGRVKRQVAAVFADLRHADAVFSTYRDDSEVSRWERGELTLDAADDTLAEVLALCEQARDRTGGWFDPHGLPDPRTGVPRYDPSGLVKGWAVQRAARHLADLEGCGWLLNAGGDMLVHAPAHQPPWRVGIEDPTDRGRLLQVIERRGGAMATSGTTHRGAHIIDPHSGQPATAVPTVAVVGPELLWADVYATAAVARGPWAMDWLDGLDGYEALMVAPSGLLRVTAGWPAS
jgi:thiamine biosynthesis lipoprotein